MREILENLMEAEIFKAVSQRELDARQAKAKEETIAKNTVLITKFREIASLLGFTADEKIETQMGHWGEMGLLEYSARNQELGLFLSLIVNTPRTPKRLWIYMDPTRRGRFYSSARMFLPVALRSETIAKKIKDDLIPRFEGGDVGWGARFTPKARYRRYCAICREPIPAGTRHLRFASGQTACADCAKKAGRLLGEGTWVIAGDEQNLNEAENIFKPVPEEELKKRAEDLKKKKEAAKAARDAKRKEYEELIGHSIDTCPHCHADLRDEKYGVYAEVTEYCTESMYYDERRDSWEYGDRETNDSETTAHRCAKCGNEIKYGVDFNVDIPTALYRHRASSRQELAEAENIFKPAPEEELRKRELAREAEIAKRVEAFRAKHNVKKRTLPFEIRFPTGVCPVCGSTVLDYHDSDEDGSQRWEELSCLDCDSDFNEVYSVNYAFTEIVKIGLEQDIK